MPGSRRGEEADGSCIGGSGEKERAKESGCGYAMTGRKSASPGGGIVNKF